ncbi:MAG TPA: SDR family NAD(P)-dependent oxidoreductase [Candidatus Baltobacteraceae bacterium]|jgi:3-oxoacyl-[acyl-carrier protein] reductase
MDLGLSGKIALVTGAANGIGRAVAQALASEGVRVYLADLDASGAADAADSLRSNGAAAEGVGLDVGDANSVQEVFSRIRSREKRLDVLVNSAGILRTSTLGDSTPADWEVLSRINVGGVYLCCKAAVDMMSGQRYGKIVNLSSISAFKGGGSVGNVLYGASKAAVIALTKGFAREYAPLGINVNAVAPAVTQTPMTQDSFSNLELRARVERSIPAGRIAEPSEIAGLTLFLVSDLAAYINGSIVVIDGGLLTA